nr:SDR family NAD(P)-dependent oxidoreductase [Pseudomonas sp.]
MTESTFTERRTALITGASRGIGRVLAEALGRQGYDLILTARTAESLSPVLHGLRDAQVSCRGIELPLDRPSDLRPALSRLVDGIARLDILVLNAADGGIRVPMAEYPEDIWRTVFETNVHATQAILRALHPLLLAAPAARVLFMTTGVARRWKPHTGAYAASKAAMDAMAQIYALEVADTPIRSNSLNPGPTRTGMRAAAFPNEDPLSVKPVETLLPLLRHLLSETEAPHGQIIDADEHPLVLAGPASC